MQLLLGVRERYPFSEDVVCYAGKWVDQYGKGYSVLEGISCAGAGLL